MSRERPITHEPPHKRKLTFIGKVVEGGIAFVSIDKTIAPHQYSRETRAKPTKYDDFKAEIVRANNNNEKLQELLDRTPAERLLGFLKRYRKDEKKALTNLSFILRKAGFYSHTKSEYFAEKLDENGIPIRGVDVLNKNSKYPQTYWLTFSHCEEVIIGTLKNDPFLQQFKENPVKPVCKNIDGEIPTTYALKNKERYETDLSNLIYRVIGFRYPRRSPGQNLSTLMKDCPVQIYKMYGTYYYPISKIEELITFIKSLQGKIGVTSQGETLRS